MFDQMIYSCSSSFPGWRVGQGAGRTAPVRGGAIAMTESGRTGGGRQTAGEADTTIATTTAMTPRNAAPLQSRAADRSDGVAGDRRSRVG